MSLDATIAFGLLAAVVWVAMWLLGGSRDPPNGPPVVLFADNYLNPG